eukprot:TRINITY_DN1874_c0_g1_i1.p1 TRINITY_DN1874_c0_g1~~TRINITY_DN1874_c0_g1_i1.p1  ORF type:complete len:453 (+),score=150.92 TRINITY_DN1874_c0_g1_i1:224-1582(+)
MPRSEDIAWLQSHRVPELLNELASEMLSNRPGDVVDFIALWCQKKKAPPRDGGGGGGTGGSAAALTHKSSQRMLPRTNSMVSSQGTQGSGAGVGQGGHHAPPAAGAGLGGGAAQGGGGVHTGGGAGSAGRGGSVGQAIQSPLPSTPQDCAQTPPTEVTPQPAMAWGRPAPEELAGRHTAPEGLYRTISCIGEGHYGKVFEAVRVADAVTVAVKKVTIDGDWVEQEIECIRHCAGDRTVQLLDSHYSAKEDTLWIVMEMLGISIAHLAERVGPKAFSEQMIAGIAREMLLGLSSLHGFGKVHLDIKPGNLLVSPNWQRIKIADFGTMQNIGDDCVQLGDFAFMSPEVAYSVGKYVAQSDIWSVAITLLYLADGEAPLWREKPDLLIFMHRETCMRPGLWEPKGWSKGFSDVLFDCFMKSPYDRPMAEDLLRTEWLQQQAPPNGMVLPALPPVQ